METRTLGTTRWIITVLVVGLLSGLPLHGQSPSATKKQPSEAEKVLLEKARLLDARGQTDLATQNWRQILLSDPDNADALAGVAKNDMLAGKTQESQAYLDHLRTVSPGDPRISQIESMQKARTETPQLQRAGKLAESGQYAQAMAVYRQAYGNNPPAGDIALAYYNTEASDKNDADYAQAVAGLRALAKKYPGDPRYEINLGRILTYNPKTYSEGIAILQRYPKDSQASAALGSALAWNSGNPAYGGAIRSYLKVHPDKDLQARLNETEAKQAKITGDFARTAEERAAYNALQANNIPLAEQRFTAIKDKQPNNPRALTGLGFVQMKKNNFAGAISYFESAKANGAKGVAVENALSTSRFWFTMSEGTAALAQNQLDVAIAQFRKALDMRPSNPDALTGLAGTLLRAQQPAEAAQVYAHLAKVDPSSPDGWRGLFTAQYMMGDAHEALSTVGRFPAPVRIKLASDPEYLTNLAAAYNAVGDQADSQRVLAQAMEIPFPDNGAKLDKDKLLQFADLLMQANRYDQASGLYRQVISADANNTAAYEGLVRAQHATGNDALALTTVEQMPSPVLTVAERDPGFLATIAAIYQSQGKLDIAQKLLEQAVTASTAGGQPAAVGTQLELAGVYVARGNPQAAYAIYQQVLSADPTRIDAWKGLLSALHDSGSDREALSEIKLIPPQTLVKLNLDPQYLQVLASIYSDSDNKALALITIRQAAVRYQQTSGQPPVGFAVQYCYLLMNAGDDQGLYIQLMQLGSRSDLTADQRSQVQTVWAVWSVRRAAAASKHGNYHRAVQILDAANRAFPDNIDVQKALAGGYQQAGDSKRAEAIYLQMDWTNAKAPDYRAAIGAALVAHDRKQAQIWLDSGLKQFPNDPQILQEAGEFEQARGDNNRAAEYYKASLDAMGPEDPAQSLLSDMKKQPDVAPGSMMPTNPSQDLINMLAPGTDAISTGPVPLYEMAPMQPAGNYLPGQPPVPVQINPNGTPVAPVAGSQPMYAPAPRKGKNGQQPQNVERLGDYNPPQSSLSPADLCALNRMAGVECNQSSPDNSGWTVKAARWQAPAQQSAPGQTQQDTEVHVAPHSRLRLAPTASSAPTSAPAASKPVAVPVQPAASASPAPVQIAQVSQTSQPAPRLHLHMPGAAPATPTNASQVAATAPAVPQQTQTVEEVPGIRYAPAAMQETYHQAQYQTTSPNYAAPSQSPAPPAQIAAPPQPYSAGPPPNSGNATGQQGYGTYSQGAGQAYNPTYGPGYSNYSDSTAPVQQQPYYARNLPPLTGTYQQSMPHGGLQTQRDQVQSQLAALQGGYSPWVGGSAYVSYRSGTAGFDRFVVFATPLEASAMLNDSVRATIVVKPVFISSGTPVASPTYSQGTLGFDKAPPTQTASGSGGELQIRSTNYGGSLGYTPYGFVVGNYIGSVYAKPQGGPFTLTFSRDSITDTQLSYSGLHDTGQANLPIWGGVIANSGEIQYATTTDHSGYYVQGGGQYITGKSVENNAQVNGDAGAYWRMFSSPEYGDFKLGMNIFAMHYNHNLRYFTFGQGGYFSPDAYLLANVPVSFDGHSGRNFHYKIDGSLGVQAFQEDSSPFFPLLNSTSSCTSTSTNCYPTRSSVSGNYLIDAEAAYRMSEHWFVGAFFNANNSRDYNTATGGFYVRYMFRSQFPTEEGPPTGIFPVNGLRPVTVP